MSMKSISMSDREAAICRMPTFAWSNAENCGNAAANTGIYKIEASILAALITILNRGHCFSGIDNSSRLQYKVSRYFIQTLNCRNVVVCSDLQPDTNRRCSFLILMPSPSENRNCHESFTCSSVRSCLKVQNGTELSVKYERKRTGFTQFCSFGYASVESDVLMT